MSTRFNSNSMPNFNVAGIQTGYGTKSSPSDLTVPACGVEDVDAALFNLFDKEIPFQVSTSDKNRGEMKRVPIIFSAAEKWALAKRSRGVRDRNGALILPLITVIRTTIQQTPDEDITGRGINQQTGEIVVKRRLDNSDRAYQGLINRLGINHQTNLAVKTNDSLDVITYYVLNENGDRIVDESGQPFVAYTATTAASSQLITSRKIGDLADDPTVIEGGLLLNDKKNNVYETLVLPAPQFFTAVYEVTFWTQYTVQMFQLVEMLISSFLPQGNAWRLDSPKGYWFIATVDGNVYNAENNFDDMSQEERLIKYKFTIKVPGYILASGVPGAPVPVKRYVSSPVISFDIGLNAGEEIGSDAGDPFLGSDDPTLPLDDAPNKRRDQRNTGRTRLYPGSKVTSPNDPALAALGRGRPQAQYKKITGIDRNGNQVTKYARVVNTNRFTGETVFAPGTDLGGLTIVVTDD